MLGFSVKPEEAYLEIANQKASSPKLMKRLAAKRKAKKTMKNKNPSITSASFIQTCPYLKGS
jgi:hypothetical protein